MSTETITAPRTVIRPRAGYGTLWRGVPRELGFLLLTMPVAIIGMVAAITLFSVGLGTIILVFGIFILLASLYVARAFGTLELVRLRWAGRGEIARPRWQPLRGEAGFWRRFVAEPLANGHSWLYLLHTVIISPIISILSWSVTITWLATGLGGSTYWFWSRWTPDRGRDFWLHEVVLNWMVPGSTAGLDPRLGENLFELVVGLIFLVTLPFITRGLTLMHQGVARGLLGAWPSEALQRQVADLSASRGAAVAAEDHSLRRLERDIHDGPQQRLVRLQMDLAAAERRLETDPDAAKAMLEEARGQARDALEELRALSRGFAPPLLQDRGLRSAVEALAARSPIPVEVEIDEGLDESLPSEIERAVYFVAAELVTNAVKHSDASGIRLKAVLTDAASGARELTLWVVDNGSGGARAVAGHGLNGLDERARGLGGTLSIDSPAGGPTAVALRVPVPPVS